MKEKEQIGKEVEKKKQRANRKENDSRPKEKVD